VGYLAHAAAQTLIPATIKLHPSGGLAARTYGVLTMHALRRPETVGTIDGVDETDPKGLKERWADGRLRAGP
jgi:hypothetical protein